MTSTEDVPLKDYYKMREAVSLNEAPTVPQSAFVSILGSAISN